MATEALQELIRSYDMERTGFLNKIEWVKLCSHDTINLSPELASALFDGLDTDADGEVRINDIMKELAAYEAGESVSLTPGMRSVSMGSVFLPSPVSTTTNIHAPKSPRKIPHPVVPVIRESRGQNRRLYERRARSGLATQPRGLLLDLAGDPYTAKKEITEDGGEVFSITPISMNPRFKNLVDLENVISRNYPELLPTFNNMLEDIRSEMLATREEKHTLEENYLKEKAARKQDLIRMENELEMQIQRFEERTKTEVHDRIRGEYDAMIHNKEKEIADIRAQVEMLKAKIKDDDKTHRQSRTTPDSTTIDQSNWDSENPAPTPTPWPYMGATSRRSGRQSRSNTDEENLRMILEQLENRESELATLKMQLEVQEKQIECDKRELLNQEEEKLQLYQQLQSMRELIKRMNGTGDDMYSAMHGSLSRGDSTRSMNEVDMTTPKPPERMFKVILVGDMNVGKSSFMHQFCDGVFYTKLRTTIGVDFRTRNFRVDNAFYTIQLWDTAGQEQYRSMVRTYFRKVDGVLIIYDVSKPDSFQNVRSWMEDVADNTTSHRVPIVIVGNKIDLREAGEDNNSSTFVSTEMGRRFAQSHGVMFIETSVCKAENVDEAVRILSREMKIGEDEQLATVALKADPPKKVSGCCN